MTAWDIPTGDQLLIAIAQVLKNILRRSDTVARLGGDEFVILLDGIHDDRDAVEKSKEIHGCIRALPSSSATTTS